MYAYSKTSQDRLDSCHPQLRKLFMELAKDWNISILCGHRSKEDQDAAVAAGKSKTVFPTSKHNATPSNAVDATLYPVQWNDLGRHYMFAGMVKQKAKDLGITIRCGADWDGDNETKDQKFNDLVHFEVKPCC